MIDINHKQIHFIIGIGRSGTTILSKLLNKYTQINCMPEANFLPFFLHHYQSKNKFSDEEIDLIFEEISIYTRSHPIVGWKLNIEDAKTSTKAFIKKNDRISYPELCTEIYNNFINTTFEKKNAPIIIDKNPSSTLFLSEISCVFEKSKFIYMIRDPRANILSRKQSLDLKSPNVPYNASRWNLYNKQAYKFYIQNPERTLLVKYEELVCNYETEITRIINFLEASPMLEKDGDELYSDSTKYDIADKIKNRFEKKYSDLNNPLNTNRINSWQKELSEIEIKLVDSICRKILLRLSYKSHFKNNALINLALKLRFITPILKGYFDVYKDKIIFYAPLQLKLKRLKLRYIKLDL